jgi:ribonuclease HI
VKRAFGINDLAEFETRIGALRTELEPPTAAGEYVAHTDGACFGNPEGPGGWAAVVDSAEGKRWLLWGHRSSTSNNRAEALGVLGALEWIPAGSRLALHSDSELTVRILEGRYKARANPDIWELIRRTIADKQLSIKPVWLRGHAGDPLNELADRLSKLGARNAESLDGLDPFDLVAEPATSDTTPPELAGLEARGDWEREFLRSVADQLRRGRKLSDKQQAVVSRIRARGAG